MASEKDLGRSDLWTLCLVTFVTTVTAATQGYDSSMMNGLQILPGFEDYFNLSLPLQSFNVAIVSLGSVFAAPFGAYIPDKYGRKWSMAATAIVSLTGATIQSAAQNSAMFLTGRFLVGVSVTLSCIVSPEYVAEVAHPKYRGSLTSLYGAFWYIGGIIASLVTFGSQYILSTWCWRLPSLLQFLPAILSIIPLPFIPESPRWLVYVGRHEEARRILIKYHGGGDENSPLVTAEYEEIRQTLEYERLVQSVGWKALYGTKGNGWSFGVCLTLAVFSQLSGTNTVSYYLGTVLDTAGVTNTNTQLGINIGLMGSLTIMGFILIIMTVLTKLYLGSDNAAASGAIVFLIFFYYIWQSLVWTPLSFVYIVEILSYSTRSSGLAAFQGACYITGFLNLYAIPYAMAWLSWGFYLITAFVCFLEAIVVFFYWPETRGLTLEEIDLVFDGEKHCDNDLTINEVEQVKVDASDRMANYNGLEVLSAELFSDVLDLLPALQDRLTLSLVSKPLYNKVIPYIYDHWDFNGYDHSFKSLYLFLRTMVENQVLASHVHIFDIRDWNKKRSDRLTDDDDIYDEDDAMEEDDAEEGGDNGGAEARAEKARRAREKETKTQEKGKSALSRQELKHQEALQEEMYDQYIPFFRTSIQNLLIPQVSVDWFSEWINNRDPDILLAVLIISLPKLTTLYMAIPDEQEGVLTALADLGGGLVLGILENLSTIFVCSALYLGIKGHREYHLDLDRSISLFKVQGLRSLSILTAMGFNPFITTFNEKVLETLSRTSTLIDLAFDESQADPESIISILSIPKSLRSLRWTQQFYCFSIGSCTTPFYDTFGKSLIPHKETLEELDLDLRHAPCESKGHAGNPHAKGEDMLEQVRDTWRSDCHLLGSLKEFSSLKKLKISPEVLCGNRARSIALARLSNSLPSSLEELTLPFQFSVLQGKRNIQLEEQIWIHELVHLVQNSASKFRKLRKITVLDWNPHFNWPRKEDKDIFKDVDIACAEVGIDFLMLKETSQWQTPVPYFLEILPTRNPGRDY
ncbi:hypothetical protein N431DRAFT_476620 [Stipitochalara longipes BDJ]|nr:hypothetical protein N431DRAFT_476620 [Stipitochalara longipes BDJ]